MVEKILKKLSFKFSITEAELNLLDAYQKKSVFQPKIRSPVSLVKEFFEHFFKLSYSAEYLTRIVFCKSVLEVRHLLYDKDFGQKEKFKIKMKLKQIKTTQESQQILHG